LPAPLPSSAIPGATSPNISRGIIKLNKFPNRALIVTNTLISQFGKNIEQTTPKRIAMTILRSNGNFSFISVSLWFDYYNFALR
jgi:hypothetical protein